jgi:hypothetical protein
MPATGIVQAGQPAAKDFIEGREESAELPLAHSRQPFASDQTSYYVRSRLSASKAVLILGTSLGTNGRNAMAGGLTARTQLDREAEARAIEGVRQLNKRLGG